MMAWISVDIQRPSIRLKYLVAGSIAHWQSTCLTDPRPWIWFLACGWSVVEENNNMFYVYTSNSHNESGRLKTARNQCFRVCSCTRPTRPGPAQMVRLQKRKKKKKLVKNQSSKQEVNSSQSEGIWFVWNDIHRKSPLKSAATSNDQSGFHSLLFFSTYKAHLFLALAIGAPFK